MVRVADIPQIAQMEVSEKLLFLEELWDSISSEEEKIPVPQSHKDELDTRYAEFLSNPGKVLSLEELRANIDRRK